VEVVELVKMGLKLWLGRVEKAEWAQELSLLAEQFMSSRLSLEINILRKELL
jgi:hypothetical protein